MQFSWAGTRNCRQFFFSIVSFLRHTQYVLYHDAAFPEKYLHTTNPCKLLELCIKREFFFFFFRKCVRICVCVHRSHATNQHISSGILITPEAFPQFYLLFLTTFFYYQGNHCVTRLLSQAKFFMAEAFQTIQPTKIKISDKTCQCFKKDAIQN